MKTLLHLGFFALMMFAATTLYAQTPQGIRYQAVARDLSGSLITDQDIRIRISITDKFDRQIYYTEIHTLQTNHHGLFSLSIGQGDVVTGVFADIPWATGDKWLKIEMDPKGGGNFVLINSSELQSVPFALFSAESK